ncbi:oligoendopeptidase F [Agaribacterium haliotis]|uniref:oligoendopeptidase F n=1 Tax=Agaribacterium haliotis TaxID=2013869 RepID=UPI000BB595EA|nr:oligoendopeptidase F [Agaribacterium haliotis]
MNKFKILPLACCVALALGCSSGELKQEQPAETEQAVDARYIWDLSDLYSSAEDWQENYSATKAAIAELENYKGSLANGSSAMLTANKAISSAYKRAVQLLVYATLKADEDTRIAENDERRQLARMLMSELSAATSWYSPELLSLGQAKVEKYMDEQPGLEPFRHSMFDTLRQAPHIRSAEVEEVLAKSGKVSAAPQSIYSTLANANLPWPEIELPNGDKKILSQAGYGALRSNEDRELRAKVFDQFWTTWKDYEATLGSVLSGHLQSLAFETDVRDYDSSVQRALFNDNMPEQVYRTLVDEVNSALPTLYRYFELRKRMLNIEGPMRYYDIYPPLVSLDKDFGIESSISLTREALKPLGSEYLAGYDAGIEGRWMHVYPQPGKRSGAYMFGAAYDVHPYVLLNHNDDYESASTFAHEYGHAVHSVLANASQPWETADYSTFIAETASIMNEMLLQDLMVNKAKSPEEKLFYLGNGLESLRGTFFRQTMFAEFELKVNEEVAAGKAMSGARFSEIYLELLKRYHGHDQGVMEIDDLYAIEWAYIPHFYYDFYVFQYATSIAAAAGLAEKIGAGDIDTRDAFIDMLKAGGSDYPYQLMKNTGMDMATPAPYRALVARMNAIMDEMEKILDEQG